MNLHQLLLDEPGSVPLDADLTGKLGRGDVVLGPRQQVDDDLTSSMCDLWNTVPSRTEVCARQAAH